MIRNKIKLFFLLIFPVMAGLYGCSQAKSNDGKEKKMLSSDTLEVIRVHRSSPDKILRLPAELMPFNEVSIFPKVNGYVKNVPVDRGSIVSKGQLLVEITAPEIDAQLADGYARKLSTDAMCQASKVAYKRIVETSATPGAVSANDLDQMYSKMLSDSALAVSANANYMALKEMKNYLRVEAPFSGIISERNISAGALVGPSAKNKDVPMLVLKEEDKLRLTVAIPESYTSQVVQQKQVWFSVKAYPEKRFSAILARRAGSLTTSIRSEMVEFDVNNGDNLLKSGMYAEIVLQFERAQPSLYVPKSAIVSSTEKVYVIKCVNGLAHKINVQTGNNLGAQVEVFGDLQEGDILVEKASDEIADGRRVAVKER